MIKRFLALLAALLALPAFADEATTAARLERVRHSPLELRRFVDALPKGGDLHNHLSGAVYAETFIRLAAADGLCIDRSISAIRPCGDPAFVPATTALTDPTLYQQLLDAMSMRQFRAIGESGHDHFFATFGKFGGASGRHPGEMLAEVVSRFARENVDYVETITSPDGGAAARLGDSLPDDMPIEDMYAALQKADVAGVVANASKTITDAEATMRRELQCGTASAQPGCDSVIRYVYEVHRGRKPGQVFAEMVVGFEMAKHDTRVVGVNPVMAEDWYVPMRDFERHMRMFRFLRTKYSTPISTHAGELAAGFVPPEGLRFHITDSVNIAGAKRIGHGVDIMRETNAEETMREMAAKHIAVEICLTSNDVILGVRGKQHPFRAYLEHHVPLVLATDDPGVSRGDSATEFQRAVEEQGATYAELKRMIRNSLEYSFLEGGSLWKTAYSERVDACATVASAACRNYLASNPKAQQQERLEERLAKFEGTGR